MGNSFAFFLWFAIFFLCIVLASFLRIFPVNSEAINRRILNWSIRESKADRKKETTRKRIVKRRCYVAM